MSAASSSCQVPVAVVGAGLTGLGAALALQALGVEHRVFERERCPGGLAVTLEEEGFRFDRTGHLLHLSDPVLRHEVLGWLDREPLSIERQSVVFSHGTYTRYPFQANSYGLPPPVAYECLLGFIRAQSQPRSEPEDFEQFCLQNFGPGITEHFMRPYNERLWGVPAHTITAAWCQRFVPVPSLEDVIAGAVGLSDRKLGYNAHFFYPRGGIGELSWAMCRRHGGVELGEELLAVDWRHRRLQVGTQTVGYQVLISTIPLVVLLGLLVEPPEELASAACSLRCSGLYYLDLGLRTPCPRPYHWVYVPEPKYPYYRVGCYSHFSPELAPPGCSSLYVELADRRPPGLDAVLDQVWPGLLEMGLVRERGDICLARLRHLEYAYVIYDKWHAPTLSKVLPRLAEAGIISTGRYGGWNYSCMEDALRFGKQAAEQAIARLV